MRRDNRYLSVAVLGAAAIAGLASCESTGAGECPGGCPAGQLCFYGACVPDPDAEAGTDIPADADAPGEADAETGGEAETGTDGAADADAGEEARTDADADTPDDADAESEAAEGDDAVADDGWADGCGPERCNALDDDCDGRTDEDFACLPGTVLSCTTWCGSAGTAACSDACLVPGTCTPPDEICDNRADDNCDGSIDEGCGGTNDTCAAPLDISAGGTFTGSTATMANDAGAPRTCVSTDPPTPAPDAFFFFDLTETSDVFVNSSGSFFDTVVYVGRTCGGGELGCNDDMDPPGGSGTTSYLDSGVTLRGLAAGRYYVTLDGWAADQAGDYTLTLYRTPAAANGDRCGNPIAIAPGTTTVSGDTCPLSPETAATCGGARNDGVYWFTVGATRTVSFSTCSAATTFDSMLYLRSDCDDASSELACNEDDASCAVGTGGSRLSTSLEPGIYYLFVDASATAGSGCGAFQLAVTGL
ncbi:MAG: hypothetical protein HY907_20210 [Deltaproteobacteria bacterium]|nr:hypothetical protein [Deltaproteobacteria bacterium]